MAWYRVPLTRSAFDNAKHLEILKRFYERWLLSNYAVGASMYRTLDPAADDQTLFFSVSDGLKPTFDTFFSKFGVTSCAHPPAESVTFVVGEE